MPFCLRLWNVKQRLMDRSTNTTWMVSVTASTVYFLQSACKQKSCSYAGSLIKCQTGASFFGGGLFWVLYLCVCVQSRLKGFCRSTTTTTTSLKTAAEMKGSGSTTPPCRHLVTPVTVTAVAWTRLNVHLAPHTVSQSHSLFLRNSASFFFAFLIWKFKSEVKKNPQRSRLFTSLD